MTQRYENALADALEWVEVSSAQPCPVCAATSQCCVHGDGEFVRCLNVVCDWPVVSGGWLHHIEIQVIETT